MSPFCSSTGWLTIRRCLRRSVLVFLSIPRHVFSWPRLFHSLLLRKMSALTEKIKCLRKSDVIIYTGWKQNKCYPYFFPVKSFVNVGCNIEFKTFHVISDILGLKNIYIIQEQIFPRSKCWPSASDNLLKIRVQYTESLEKYFCSAG